MLKRGDILRNTRSGRFLVIRSVRESSAHGYYWVTALKVRKTDGVAWGRRVIYVIRDGQNTPPWGHELVTMGTEPLTLTAWRKDE